MFKFIKVTGKSLWPVYKEGDFVLVTKIPFFFKRIKRGDVVVFRHPQLGALIKCVDGIDQSAGNFYVTGIHPDSLDSRKLGAIHHKDIIGKVVFHFKSKSSGANGSF